MAAYDQIAAPDRVYGYVDSTDRENANLAATLITEFEAGTTHHTILAGLEYISTSSDQDRFNAFWSTSLSDKEAFIVSRPLGLAAGIGINAEGLSVSNDFSIDLNDESSAFLQDEIELNERLSAVVGLRFDQFDIKVMNVPADELRTRRDREVSPRFGLIYKWSENTSLYGSLSETFLPRSGEQYANINGDKRLDPDTFRNVEVGLKWDIELYCSVF